MATPSLPVKSHSSPSKVRALLQPNSTAHTHTPPSLQASYGRTYDSKLVSREMHRLGNLAHLPAALAPPITTAASASSLALPVVPQPNLPSTSSADPWGALHVHVLPLFNGEPLRIPIEDLNVLVKRHIQSAVSSAPSRALASLEHDAADLIAAGMVTLNAKLAGIDDEKLVPRVVEIWGFFWDQVLTYVEGVLLPLQTDALLLSLHRAPKPAAPAPAPTIDVRSVALRAFRDRVILPLAARLYARLAAPARPEAYQEAAAYQGPRLQQMLLVLTSQRRPRALAFSLTAPTPSPTPGEQAITDLLHAIRSPSPSSSSSSNPSSFTPLPTNPRAPSFLSGGLPRDRRGRIAHKGLAPRPGDDSDVFSIGGGEREREREVLEALRSPDVDAEVKAGGWGLGDGDMDEDDGEEDEEGLEQAIVDYMGGMGAGGGGTGAGAGAAVGGLERRRGTN
ncbi:hypothetical protein DXG01_015155 [Tephrocybe rancida]|nr:hypothetical protein DXG01_015155 [Tephrocybe rancida]